MSHIDVAGPSPLTLGIVGGGPSATYSIERLAATAQMHVDEGCPLHIHIFDRGGHFGAGDVHSTRQPTSSYLNRIVGQVAFAADESVDGAGPLLPVELRPTLVEWCQQEFARTGDPAFNLPPEGWPKRYMHGLALESSFRAFTRILRETPGVTVSLHTAEVTDVQRAGNRFAVRTSNGHSRECDQVLLVTGHSNNDPWLVEGGQTRARFAARTRTAYISAAYPLEQTLSPAVAPPDATVGLQGMGLTAIDAILYLTEGRGGRFQPSPSGLVYEPSGSEPARIVPFSEAGLFTYARPFNEKERDPSRLEHRGVFLTESNCDRLRDTYGVAIDIPLTGRRRQLDFERHVMPLVLLEMHCLYYRTLLGSDFGDAMVAAVAPAVDDFLGGIGDLEYAQERLLQPLEDLLQQAVAVLDCGKQHARAASTTKGWDPAAARAALDTWTSAFLAALPEARQATFDRRLVSLLFSWRETIAPSALQSAKTATEYTTAFVTFMEHDHAHAAMGNVSDPVKAVTDGVWRDLRQVLAHVIDFGGLTAESHRRFLAITMRHHNRLGNGAALEVMEKILCLVRSGIVDIAIGPNGTLNQDEDEAAFVVRGPITGHRARLDVLVDARVHGFQPLADERPLFRNLISSGLVQQWVNPSHDGAGFVPGGLALTDRFHPVSTDSEVVEAITVLGPPSEGVMFFQLGALRPNQNHHVMQDILVWLASLWRAAEAQRNALTSAGATERTS